MVCLIGCGIKTQQQVISKIEIQKVKVPKQLLHLNPLEKPRVDNELDILNAYSILFYHYKQCIINIEKIKSLQGDEK